MTKMNKKQAVELAKQAKIIRVDIFEKEVSFGQMVDEIRNKRVVVQQYPQQVVIHLGDVKFVLL